MLTITTSPESTHLKINIKRISSPLSIAQDISFSDYPDDELDHYFSLEEEENVTLLEGFLSRLSKKSNKIKKYWFKLINKDLYCIFLFLTIRLQN